MDFNEDEIPFGTWINVKDHMPLEKYTKAGEFCIVEDYIVHFSDYTNPNEMSNVGYAEYQSNGQWNYCGRTPHTYWADKITHWMPFPKAPKEFDKYNKKRSIRESISRAIGNVKSYFKSFRLQR